MYTVSLNGKDMEVRLFDNIQYTDSLTHNREYDTTGISINLEPRGVLVLIHPSSLNLTFRELDSHNTGGGCWFCGQRADDSDEFKPFLVYAIDPTEVEIERTTLISSTIRRSHRVLCRSCYSKLTERISSNPELMSNII